MWTCSACVRVRLLAPGGVSGRKDIGKTSERHGSRNVRSSLGFAYTRQELLRRVRYYSRTTERDEFHGCAVHASLQQLQGFQSGSKPQTGQSGDGSTG